MTKWRVAFFGWGFVILGFIAFADFVGVGHFWPLPVLGVMLVIYVVLAFTVWRKASK